MNKQNIKKKQRCKLILEYILVNKIFNVPVNKLGKRTLRSKLTNLYKERYIECKDKDKKL